jgi:hypothetical protein
MVPTRNIADAVTTRPGPAGPMAGAGGVGVDVGSDALDCGFRTVVTW